MKECFFLFLVCRPTLDQLREILLEAQRSRAPVAAAHRGSSSSSDPLIATLSQTLAAAESWISTAQTLTDTLGNLSRIPGHPLHTPAHAGWGRGSSSSRAAEAAAAAARQQAGTLANPEVLSAVVAARNHLAAAEGLGCGVDSEVEGLSEACKVYCLCQGLYDERRPMLGCDYCSDWFHWDCVGLQPPRDGQDESEAAPPDFRCARI